MKVVHCKIEPYDVYIGRPSCFGNPFSHKSDTLSKYRVATVEEAVSKYEEYLRGNQSLLNKLIDLKGKILGCWCKTKKNPNALCHGDVIIKLIEEIYGKDDSN